MWVRIIENADHRISSAKSQSFTAGSKLNLPRKTAEALIGRGKAEPVTADTTTEKGS